MHARQLFTLKNFRKTIKIDNEEYPPGVKIVYVCPVNAIYLDESWKVTPRKSLDARYKVSILALPHRTGTSSA
jgi:hypothetical protein